MERPRSTPDQKVEIYSTPRSVPCPLCFITPFESLWFRRSICDTKFSIDSVILQFLEGGGEGKKEETGENVEKYPTYVSYPFSGRWNSRVMGFPPVIFQKASSLLVRRLETETKEDLSSSVDSLSEQIRLLIRNYISPMIFPKCSTYLLRSTIFGDESISRGIKIGIKVLLSIEIIVERRDRWKGILATGYLKKKGINVENETFERRKLNPRVLRLAFSTVSEPINYLHPIFVIIFIRYCFLI